MNIINILPYRMLKNKLNKMKKRNIIIIILLLVLFNPLSLYFLYGGSKISTGVIKDSLSSKKTVYLEICSKKNMLCDSNEEKTISSCEYTNTKNCACYECLSNFNFDNCSQCYMPATTEVFCINNKCKIPNFP